MRSSSFEPVGSVSSAASIISSSEASALPFSRIRSAARRAYLVRDGELVPFPSGLVMGVPRGVRQAVGASAVTGMGAALRAAFEPFIPGRVPDGPVAAVTSRRLGSMWAKRLVFPLVEGVYGAPAEELGIGAALPQFAGRRSMIGAAKRITNATRAAVLSIEGG